MAIEQHPKRTWAIEESAITIAQATKDIITQPTIILSSINLTPQFIIAKITILEKDLHKMVINSIKLQEKPSHIKITNRFIEDQQTSAIKD